MTSIFLCASLGPKQGVLSLLMHCEAMREIVDGFGTAESSSRKFLLSGQELAED